MSINDKLGELRELVDGKDSKVSLHTHSLSVCLSVCLSVYLSKVVERLACQQLVAYLEQHDVLPRLQSAYRRFHSTETSILKLACDALLAAVLGSVTLLGLLDLLAAFDTVDHHILISQLQSTFGIHGTVLQWVTNRTQTVNFAGQQSTIVTVICTL